MELVFNSTRELVFFYWWNLLKIFLCIDDLPPKKQNFRDNFERERKSLSLTVWDYIKRISLRLIGMCKQKINYFTLKKKWLIYSPTVTHISPACISLLFHPMPIPVCFKIPRRRFACTDKSRKRTFDYDRYFTRYTS